MKNVKESDLTLNSFLIPRIRVLCGKIRLKPNVTAKNYYSSILHNLILGFLLGSIELLQRKLLNDSEYYNLPHDEALITNVLVLIADLVSRLFLFPLCGFLIDKYGRQKMNLVAYLSIAIGVIFFPLPFFFLSTPEPFPWLYTGRIIYAAGSSMLITMPFVGDYVENECKGKAMGINTLALGLGIVVSGILVEVSPKIPLTLSQTFIGVIVIILLPGLISNLLLKRGVSYYQAYVNQYPPSSNSKAKLKMNSLKMTLRVIKRRPWVYTGFIFSFLCGMNLGIISLHHYIITPANQIMISHEPGDMKTLQYSFLIAVFINLTLEILLDLVKTLYIVFAVFFFGIISYSIIGNISDAPNAILLIFIAACFISCLGCFSLLNYLEYKHCPRVFRGNSYGIKMSSLVVGMLVTVITCGLTNGIFTSYTNNTLIFYIMVGFIVLGLFIFIIVYVKYIRQSDKFAARKQGTGIKTLLFIDGIDQDLLEKAEYERHFLDQVNESQFKDSEVIPHQASK